MNYHSISSLLLLNFGQFSPNLADILLLGNLSPLPQYFLHSLPGRHKVLLPAVIVVQILTHGVGEQDSSDLGILLLEMLDDLPEIVLGSNHVPDAVPALQNVVSGGAS